MIKKIAILALAVSAAFSSAFAADEPECVVTLTGDAIFSGKKIEPTVTKIVCNNEEFTNNSDFKKIEYINNVNVGTASVIITLNDDKKVSQNFEIKRKGVRLIVNDCEKELGGVNPEFTWTIDEKSNVGILQEDTLSNFMSELQKKVKLTVPDGVEAVGNDFEISSDPTVDLSKLFPNYNIIVKSGHMIITKTLVAIKAKSVGKVYGEKDPEFTYTIEGNIKKDDYSKLGKIALSRADDSENVGEYEISVSTNLPDYKDEDKTCPSTYNDYETDNYCIKVESGTLTIQQAPVTVTVNSVTKVYGEATPEFTYKVAGLVGEDVLKDVSLSCAKCSATDLENVGEYAISASVDAKSNSNYTVTTKDGSLTVTQKAATVTVVDTTKTYGDKDPKFTFTTEGLVTATESLEGAAITRVEGDSVGTYKINVVFAEGSNPNYKLTLKSGTLTISPKAVTLTVDDVSKKFGEKDPELTYKVDGLVTIGEDEDKLKGVTLSREKGEDAGEYAITATVDAKANPNYTVAVDEKKGVFTIKANNDEIVVTVKGHTSAGVYNGKEQIVKGFDISTESKAYDLKFVEFTGDSIVSGTDAGTYKMGLSKDNFKNTSANYPNVTFEVTDGSLEITPKSIVVSAVADSITYGDSLPTEFKWTVDSLLKGDTLGDIHVSLEKTGLLDAGEYELDFDKKDSTTKNYVVSKYVPATFKVLKRNVTVSIADTSKVYGSRDPALDSLVTITGLRAGDSLEGITVAREKGEDVRLGADGQIASYKIAATIDEEKLNKNYQVKVKQGNFTIKPYADKITVLIFGDRVERDSTGDTITVDKSYDVKLCGAICGEAPLDSGFEYSVNFVTYRDSVILIDPDTKDTVIDVTTTSVSGVRAYLYPFNLRENHFVNISPNFSNVEFRITTDGTLIIKKPVEIPTKIITLKGADLFGLSSAGRRIQVSGSTVGNRFEVRDMQGKVVRSGFVSAANFEIPVANAGVYLVRVGSVVRKVRIK